jgi:cysteine desulfurase / selenocysteine lyase
MTDPADPPKRRIYFDHAATSWPKAPQVAKAMSDFIQNNGASAGRGVSRSSQAADEIVMALRRQLMQAIGAPSPDCISFHCGGTAALNAAIIGLCRPGDHIVTTAAEHNSVLRPLEHLRSTQGITVTIVPIDSTGQVIAEEILAAVEKKPTRMVVMSGASNVTGFALPVAQVGQALAGESTIVVCDAAQSFGWIPIDVQEAGVDVLATPAHKASGGPLGIACLYVHPSLHDEIRPTLFGGTGSQSESLEMPTKMPGKLEAGSLNVPAIAGWSAALNQWPNAQSIISSEQRIHLCRRLYGAVSGHSNLTVVGSSSDVPIASVYHPTMEATELAIILDTEFAIEARAGLHCSAATHRYLGTPPGGLLRFSAGPETSDNDFNSLHQALTEISSEQ